MSVRRSSQRHDNSGVLLGGTAALGCPGERKLAYWVAELRSAGQPRAAVPTLQRWLLILLPRRLELIALLPLHQLWQACRLPAQRKPKPRHRAVPGEIHLGMILIARLVVVLLDVLTILRQPPGFIVALKLHPLVDRE